MRGRRYGHGVLYAGHGAHAETRRPGGMAAVRPDIILARQILLYLIVGKMPDETDVFFLVQLPLCRGFRFLITLFIADLSNRSFRRRRLKRRFSIVVGLFRHWRTGRRLAPRASASARRRILGERFAHCHLLRILHSAVALLAGLAKLSRCLKAPSAAVGPVYCCRAGVTPRGFAFTSRGRGQHVLFASSRSRPERACSQKWHHSTYTCNNASSVRYATPG